MMEEDSVTQDNKLLTEELYEIIVDKNDAQVECLEDVQMQCQEDAQIRYHDPLTNPPADLPQEMSTSLLFMTPKKGSADTQNLGNFSKNPSTPAKIGSNSLKSPKAPTMTVGTKRKLVEKEPTKMKLQNFFTVIKKDEKKLCHKNLIDCTGNDSSEMNGNMNASFDEYFPSFYLKPTAKLAPIFNKLHYKRHESEVGKFSTLTRTSDSCKSTSENCWRQKCQRMQESMLIHLKKIQEMDGEETINVPYKLLQFHDNYRPAYFGTWSKVSELIRPRHPFGKDKQHFDYSVDSDEDWEEEDFEGSDVEDLNSENESDEELEDEESVAGCGGGEEFEGDGWVVPHGYLSEGEGVQEIDSDDEDHDVDNEDEIQRKGDPLSPDFTIEDDPFEKAKLKKSIKEKSKFVVIGQGISSKATFNPIKTGIALAPKIIGPIFIANDGIRIEKATCQYSVFDVEKLKQYALSFVDDLSESLEKLNILVSHDSTILAPVGVNPFEYVFSVDKDSEELLPMLSLRQKDNDSGNGGKEQKRLIKERERQEKKEAKEQKRTMLEAEKKRKLEENNKRKIEEREYKRKQLELEQDFKRKQQIDIRENLENQFGGSLNTIMPLDTLFGTISETHVPPNMLLKEFTEAMRLPFIKLVHGSVLGQSKLYEEFKRRVAPVTRKLFEDKLMDWTIKEKRAEANTKKFLWIIKADILLDCGLTEDQLLSLIQLNSAIKVVPSVDPHMRGRPFQSLSISLPNRPSQRSTRESSSGLTCESTHANILLPRHYNFLQKSSPYNPFMTGIGLSLTAEAPLLENPSMDEEADTLIEL